MYAGSTPTIRPRIMSINHNCLGLTKMILKKGTDVHVLNKFGKTSISSAIDENLRDIVEELKKEGAVVPKEKSFLMKVANAYLDLYL